ncbi:MAG: quinoprotein glucose dehydrogenase, partial [Alphaproteobacteria bacterium HGW-Alphaproteobacteria-5]
TAGGILLIGATLFDSKLRAFDTRSGRIIWETSLPYAGMASPITYSVRGRQYVLIAASNARNPKGPQGSAYVAYTLPRGTGAAAAR